MTIQDFLNEQNVAFDTIEHAPTYTAQSLAQAVHTPGQEVAKTVLLKVDDGYLLAVLPATYEIDFGRVASALGGKRAELADEEDCGDRFADCELGALPPFGSKYGLRTIVDKSLLEDEHIIFEGNTHHEAIRMRCDDYISLEDPIVQEFAHHV